MAEKKYLDYEGLTEVVNKSKQNFQKKEFIGTAAEWALVPSADKAKYDVVNITDDNQGAPVATTSVAGIVKPDGTTIGVESDGTIKATVFTGTTGDWSQLSLAEKVKYSIVNLTDDYNQGNFQYSTTEQKTGKRWIDGKPIYSKTYLITTGDTLYVQTVVATLDLSVDTVVDYYGKLYVTAPSGYFVSQLNDINWSSSGPVPLTRVNIRKTTSQSNYTCAVSVFDNGRLSQPGIITVEYTKTTD